MKDSILGEVYASLSREELKKLNQYMKYSEWSDSTTIVKCHEYYAHHVREKNEDGYDKKSLFHYIYPSDSYNDSKLRFTQNRLLKAIRQFIVNYEFERDNIFTSKLWMDFLIDKKLRKNLQYHSQEEKLISNSEYRYLNEYFKSQEDSHLSFQNHKQQDKQYQALQNVIEKAQLFSDLVFIRNFCSLYTFQHTFQSQPVELPIDKFNRIKEHTNLEQHPEFKVYIYLLELLIKKDDISYHQYKLALFETLDNWGEQEKINLLIYLRNYNTKQINEGKIEFFDEQYSLYKEFDIRGIFYIEGFFNHTMLNNVIITYLRKGYYQEAEDFLHKYIHNLHKEIKPSCLHYNLARIHFEKNQYKECMKELLYVDFSKDAFYSLNSKVLLLKTYFELKESDALDSLFTSFREFIKKNKVISEVYKTTYLNFVKLSKKIYESTKSNYPAIQIEIKDSKNIAEKIWLLSKVS